MKTLFTGIKALLFMSGVVLLWFWIASSVRPFDRRFGLVLPAWAPMIGMIFVAAGASLALVCVAFFVVRGGGTPAPFDAPTKFVATGPYKHVRNPMYIGGMGGLIGFGLYQRSASILVFALAWFLLAHLFVVGYEEPTLRRKFKDSYEDYCRAVPRWMPRQ